MSKIQFIKSVSGIVLILLMITSCRSSEEPDGFVKATPLSPGEQAGFGTNIALGKFVRVTQAMLEYPAANAVDGDQNSFWNSGGNAPQIIEVDLGAPYTLGEVRFTQLQDPAGRVEIHLYVRGPGTRDKYEELTIYEGDLKDKDMLVFTLPEPREGIQLVRLETQRSPSWVGFREIEVFSPEETP